MFKHQMQAYLRSNGETKEIRMQKQRSDSGESPTGLE